MSSIDPRTLLVLSTLALGSACGKGAVGEAVRPDERTASEAMGEETPAFDCTAVAPASEPLVVDWPDQQRMDLALALQEGVAVVHYGCDGLRLIKHCAIEGSYRFAGAGMMQRVISLDSKDSVQASLPLQGVKLSAEVGGSSKIDIATAIIGRKGTLVTEPATADLKGECEGATHYVRAAYVGAFSMATGTMGQARAAAEIFKAGASADSSSAKSMLATDGDLTACESYEGGSTPPPKCQTPVRLEISPIVEGGAAPAAATPPAAQGSDPPLSNVCVEGFVFSQGRCIRKTEEAGYRCDPSNLQECEDQCGRGNGDSCYNAGQLLHRAGIHRPGTPVPPGEDYESMLKKAAPFYEQGCKADVAPACNQLAGLYGNGQGGMPKDPKKAEELLLRACGPLMYAQACSNLASKIQFSKGGKAQIKRVLELYQRSCDLGSPGGCGSLGSLLVEGKNGAPKDPVKGMAVLEAACDEAKMPSLCWQISDYAAKGKFVRKDPARAADYMKKACAFGLKSKECGT